MDELHEDNREEVQSSEMEAASAKGPEQEVEMVFVNEPLDVSSLPQLKQGSFNPLHKEYMYVRLVGLIIFFAMLSAAGVFVYFNTDLEIWHIYLPLGLIFILQISLLVFGFKKKGYQMREHDISYQTGLIFNKITTVPLVRIQHSEVTRGPLQRLFDLATVKIYTAGGQQSDLSIPGLQPDEAKKVADYINKIVRGHAEG
jgi:membrane protein YdbS with pleckstrin-like domain